MTAGVFSFSASQKLYVLALKQVYAEEWDFLPRHRAGARNCTLPVRRDARLSLSDSAGHGGKQRN